MQGLQLPTLEEVQYSITRTRKVPYLKQVDGYYNLRDGYNLGRNDDIAITMSIPHFSAYGLEDKPVYMLKKNLTKSVREKGNNEHYSAHAIPENVVRKISEHIKEPGLVVVGNGRVSIIADEKVRGKYNKYAPLLIGMNPNGKVDGEDAYEIKSLYGVDNFGTWLRLRAKDSRIFAGKSNKAVALLQQAGVQFSRVMQDATDLTDLILAQDNDTVN